MRRSIASVAIFSGTLFLGAFLLFTVELIVAKAVLPTLGGVPMVWNTCVVFFQIVLLAGYVYAHGATTLIGSRSHVGIYAVLLVLPFFVLPFSTVVTSAPSAGANPVGWLILLLAGWIGLPFFVLSTGAAVLQDWFSSTGDDPYFLYAASNMGSLLALVLYPSVVEPFMRLRVQSRLWGLGYAAFVAAAYLCAILVRRGGRVQTTQPGVEGAGPAPARTDGEPITASRRAKWVALSFIPSSLMLAVTSYLSTDIAAVPLLWMVPLALYLLTFVLAFGSRSRSIVTIVDRILPLVILPLALLMGVEAPQALWLVVPLHLIAFTMAGLLCHGRLAADRPPASSLTEFYFWIACGGMLGGLFNTLAAPVLFTTVVEYPLVLVVVCLFRAGDTERGRTRSFSLADLVLPLVIGALTIGLTMGLRRLGVDPRLAFVALMVPVFIAFSQSRRHPIRFALGLGALLVAGGWLGDGRGQTLHTERTFFGVYRIRVDASGRYRALFSGTTLHGMQAIDGARQREPLTYYYRTGPLGDAMERIPNVARATEVAAVGLGVGSLASYASPTQRWTFFELDPAVERLARTSAYFTYLRDCGERCQVVLGDARISLGREPARQFGLLVLDAFSSDAIPIHLLTSEAFSLYLSHLAPGGILALHISNRHLSLAPIVARLADQHGLTALERRDGGVSKEEALNGKSPSDWVLMARSAADLAPLPSDPNWVAPTAVPSTPLWTDESSSILSVLRFH